MEKNNKKSSITPFAMDEEFYFIAGVLERELIDLADDDLIKAIYLKEIFHISNIRNKTIKVEEIKMHIGKLMSRYDICKISMMGDFNALALKVFAYTPKKDDDSSMFMFGLLFSKPIYTEDE